MRKKVLIYTLPIVVFLFVSFGMFDHNERSNRVGSPPDLLLDKKPYRRVDKACILALVRETDMDRFAKTVQELETNFNSLYKYPYVILSHEELSASFTQTVRKRTKSKMEFGVIPAEQWSLPGWIDDERLNQSLVNIGFSLGYRHMCRFFSGFFFRHPLTLKYDRFLRIDTDSSFPCPWRFDPFRKLLEERSIYAFALATSDEISTMPSLWPTILKWASGRPQAVDSAVDFVSTDRGATLDAFTPCVFYNNFELASFAVFRSEQYLSYFEHLDKSGGFFYERWGDAPVHTYYVALMLNKSQVSFMQDLPYAHQDNAIFKSSDCKKKRLTSCNAKWTGSTGLMSFLSYLFLP